MKITNLLLSIVLLFWSSQAGFAQSSGTGCPDAPVITSATAGVNKATIYVNPPANSGGSPIVNYEYSLDNGISWIPLSPASVGSPLEISGLVNCTTYNIQVRAINSSCSGASSAAASVTPRTGQPAGSYWTLRNSAADNTWNSVAYGNGVFVAVSSSGTGNRVMTSPDGITWTSRNAAVDNDWRSVTFGNGLFVAVASSGTGNRVMTSPDGITWTSQNSPADNSWYSVTYGNGLFVAVAITGTGNRVMTSPDGINWTARNSAADNNWYSVTYGNGLFVAVAISGTGNRVMTSPDGLTWTSQNSAADNEWRSVAFGNGLFVAVAGTSSGIETFDRVMTSPDGLIWTIRTCPRENRWCSVTYANGLFLAVSNSGDRNPMISTNGIDWSMRSAALNNNWFSVVYGNGMFVAVAQTGTGSRVMTSTNVLMPDKPVISSVTAAADYASLEFSGPSDIGGSAIGNYEYSLDNGVTWEVPSSTFSPLTVSGLMPSTAYQIRLRGVNEQGAGCPSEFSSFTTLQSATVPGGGTITSVTPGVSRGFVNFIPPANDGGGLISNYQYSLDSGATWTSLTPATSTSPLEISGLTNCLTYSVQIRAVNSAGSGPASGAFSFTPRGGESAGIKWTIRSSAANNAWNSVTCANSQFVAVAGSGVNNRVMVSSDGINWNLRNTSVNFRWRSVTYGNGLFVAIAIDGTGNRVMTSPDGLNWVTRNSAEDNEWVSVAYGNGLFVAVAINGTGNRVMTSPDGINWTARAAAAPLNIQWYSVIYGNGLFVAVGTLGFGNGIMTSPDGINWTLRNSPADNNWFSVTYGNGQFVAVAGSGNGNRVMTSPDGINWSLQSTPIGLQEWYSVTYGNGLFVAVAYFGSGDKLMTSPDGVNWTIRTPPADNSWTSVTYGNGIFVAVANSGLGNRVMTSSDALVPDKPMIDNINPGLDNLNVVFTAPADLGGSAISNYQYSLNNGSTWVTLSPVSTTSPIIITGLTPATTYQVQLRAINAQGLGCPSVTMTVTTTSASCTDVWYADLDGDGYSSGDTVIACTAPNGYFSADSLTAITGDCMDTVASVNPGAAEICFNNIDDNCNGIIDEGSSTNTTTASACGSYTWSVNGQTYTSSGSYSSVSGCNTEVLNLTVSTASSAPVITSATAGVSSALINFTPPANSNGSEIINYEYSIDGGATWTSSSPASVASPISINGLVNCTTYNIQVRAINSSCSGASSAAASVTPRSGQTAGINWISQSAPSTSQLMYVTYGNGLFVAVAKNTAVLTSPDGINWTPRSKPTGDWFSVTWGNGTFVAVSIDGKVMSSPDGVTWTLRTSAANNAWNSVTYGNGLFVAVSRSGLGNRVMTSPDGITWTSRTSPANYAWKSVTYGNGKFVAVAEYNPALGTDPNTGGSLAANFNGVMTSPDGINWTLQTTPMIYSQWYNVNYGGGFFVAVGATGTSPIMTSPDGITWTLRAAPSISTWSSVTYGEGLLVAVAIGGTTRIMTSSDAITWTARTAPAANSWRSVTYANGKFVAVAFDGTTATKIMTSSTLLVPDKPVIDSVTPGVDNLNVAFSAPLDSGGSTITNYQYSVDNGSTWVTRSPGSTSSPVIISGLTPVTSYQVQLRAVNAQGFGCPSATNAVSTTSASCTNVWYADLDGDGYSSGDTVIACTAPIGYFSADSLTAITGDCIDTVASVNPGAAEICFNNIDDNCNGIIDEGAITNTTTASACDSYTWSVNGQSYTSSGSYSSVSGCNTEVLNLTITPSTSITTTASACDTYTWSVNGQTYSSSGTYSSVSGCNTEVLNLTITPSTSNTTTASACDSYTWSVNGQTYSSSGTYSSVSGCDTEVLNLTITSSTSNTTTASACDSYTWSVNGQTYMSSGAYSSVSGCNTEVLNLTITPSTSNTTTASACDTYTWSVNGQTYTSSGTYSSVSGCNTEVLNLTITPSTSNTTTASACDSYTWSLNGQTYTSSGTYSSVSGCDTEVLNLTITPSTSNTTTVSACDTYTWSVNGQTYSSSGTYSSVSGCHTEILSLTINTSPLVTVSPSSGTITCATPSITLTASGASTYSWNAGGTGDSKSVTSSGTYAVIGTDANGCTATASATIGSNTTPPTVALSPSSGTVTCTNPSVTLTASGAVSYSWSSGGSSNSIAVTTAGTYTVTGTAANGCSATASSTISSNRTIATINATSSNSLTCIQTAATVSAGATASAGNTITGYVWSPGGSTAASFTTSTAGTYTVTVTQSNGCTSTGSVVVMANNTPPAAPALSVTQPSCSILTGTITVTAPTGAGFTYSRDGVNYQTSTSFSGLAAGTYTIRARNSFGCVSTATSATVVNNCTAALYPTSTTCSSFLSGTRQLTELCYSVSRGKISNCTPGVFFYFVKVIAPSTNFTIDVNQVSNTAGFPLFVVQSSSNLVQAFLWGQNCVRVATGIQVSAGQARVNVTGATVGRQYVLSVKYDSKSVIGASVASPLPIANYTFTTRVNSVVVPNSAVSLQLKSSNCVALRTSDNDEPKGALVAYPNPTSNTVRVSYEMIEAGMVQFAVYNTSGQLVMMRETLHEEMGNYNIDLPLGEANLANGLYFIRVIRNERLDDLRIMLDR